MTVHEMVEWASRDWTHAAMLGAGVASLYSVAWGSIRASIERTTGKPLPRTRVVLVLDVLADLAINVPSAVNRVLRANGGTPLFLPSSHGMIAPTTKPADEPRPTMTPPAPTEETPPR